MPTDLISQGGEFLVNTTTRSDQLGASMTALSNGNFVVVWGDSSTVFSSMRAQIYTAGGSPVGGELTLDGRGGLAFHPITALSNGDFVVSWSQYNDNKDQYDTHIQVFDAAGATSGSPITIAAGTAGDISSLANGGFVATWATSTGISAQVFTASGAPSGSAFEVTTPNAYTQIKPFVTGLSNGNLVVTWENDNPNGDGNASCVQAKILRPNGTTVVDTFLVNTTTSDDQYPTEITSLSDGGFLAIYSSEFLYFANGSNRQGIAVRAQRFDAAGNPIGEEIDVAGGSAGQYTTAKAVQLSTGDILFTWTAFPGGDPNLDFVQGEILTVDGSVVKAPFTINTTQPDRQINPAVATSADGHVLVAWTDTSGTAPDTSGGSIRAQLYQTVGNVPTPGNDTLDGTSGPDMIDALAGNDLVHGLGGNDNLIGNAGNDTLDGGAGADTMVGGTGNDTFYVDNAGDKVVEAAGQGTDTVHATLASYTLAANVERLYFDDAGAHTAKGNALSNLIYGNAGLDKFLIDAGGNDTFSGGGGEDTFDARSSATGMVLRLDAQANNAGSVAGDTFASIEKFFGSDTAGDAMTTGAARAKFFGYGGNDTLTGGSSIDALSGGAGNDSLVGNGGQDALDGGIGNDTMTGGLGADTFTFVDAAFGQDVITDFEDGIDRLKVFSAVAHSFSDFTVTGNGSHHVVLTLAGATANAITLDNASTNITVTAADFLFY